MAINVGEQVISGAEAMRREAKTDLLQPLAIIASGLVIAAAIYFKPASPVALEDGMFAIVDNGVAQVCIITTDRDEAQRRGTQYGFIPRCGDRHAMGR